MRPAHRLTARADFDRVHRSGRRVSAPEFVLYHSSREAPGLPESRPESGPRLGFAVGRRIGGAVARNRLRRRLREAVRPLIPRLVASDIVIVARPQAAGRGVADLRVALAEAAMRAGLMTDRDRPGGRIDTGSTST